MKAFSYAHRCISPIRLLVSSGDGREAIKMKRAIFLALLFVAILAPLAGAGAAYADLKSDEAIEQAP